MITDIQKPAASPRKFDHEWARGHVRWDMAPYVGWPR